MTGRVSASRILDAKVDDIFSVVTDVARLPEWNAAITAVIEQPDSLEVGAQWIVEMYALGQRWHSRSVVEALDPIGRCFAYRSVTDDGNPSYALWTWVVADHAEGALVTVACELHPRTFWRRILLVRVRSHQLGHTELVHSLATLETAAKRSTGARPGTTNGRQTVTQNISVDPQTLQAEAVRQLRIRGLVARRLEDGFPEWKRAGLPIAAGTGG